MAGQLVPLVLIPRFTAYSSNAEFTTIGMDMTPYQNAIVNIWRSALVGTGGDPLWNLQESTDQVTWTACGGTTVDFLVSANSETQFTAQIKKRWFRIKVTLPNANNVMTCYTVGFLEERES